MKINHLENHSASSMAQPRKSKRQQPAYLRTEYHAPFAIISRDEGSRYASLAGREFNSPRFLDFKDLGRFGLRKPIDAFCRSLSLQKFAKMRHHGYRQLMLEFYTTLSFPNDGGFHCRLMGESVTVTLKKLCEIFGFSEVGHTAVSGDFDPMGFWREIAGDGDTKNGKMFTRLIKDPSLLIMYKYIAHGIFGKDDSGTVFPKELFCLWCAYKDVPVCIPSFMVAAFKSVATSKRSQMGLGNLITAIAVHFGAFDPSDTDMLVLPTRPLGLKRFLKDYKSATEEDDDGEDSDPLTDDDQPTANTFMLISRKLEQMHEQMNNGFHAMEARFDGLEKKVNDNVVHMREMKESNGAKAVEEMKQKLFEANESIEKLRMEKSKSDEAAEMYKAELEISFTKLNKIQECVPKKNVNAEQGLPNNGDGSSPQPRTSEDDISHTVKKSLDSVALSPSAAAGDVIEIYDSDNEILIPNRAAEISKRVTSSDVGENETKISKRKRMGKSSPFMTQDKGKDVLKSSDDISEDSEDGSLSDSRMEDLVASIGRRKCV